MLKILTLPDMFWVVIVPKAVREGNRLVQADVVEESKERLGHLEPGGLVPEDLLHFLGVESA